MLGNASSSSPQAGVPAFTLHPWVTRAAGLCLLQEQDLDLGPKAFTFTHFERSFQHRPEPMASPAACPPLAHSVCQGRFYPGWGALGLWAGVQH